MGWVLRRSLLEAFSRTSATNLFSSLSDPKSNTPPVLCRAISAYSVISGAFERLRERKVMKSSFFSPSISSVCSISTLLPSWSMTVWIGAGSPVSR